MKNSLKIGVCCMCVALSAPAFAKAPGSYADGHSDKSKRHRAIEESIGRIQLDNLIASIVDKDQRRSLQSQRASRVTSNPVG